MSPYLGVSSRQRTRKGRQQFAITASRAQFSNGTWWIPDTISVTDSTIGWFNDTSVSLPLTKPMISAVDLHAHADLKAGAREAEADVSILDVKARDIRGSTSLSIYIRLLLPPPPRTSNDTDSSTSMEPVMTTNPLHTSFPFRGCAASSGSCADARRPRFYDMSTLNHALRQPDSFYSFFEASIDLNTQFQLRNLTVGVDDVAVVTTGAGIELSMSDNFTLDVGFNVHDMVNQFKFQTKFRGKDSFIRAMKSALSINATSLCWFMEQLLEPSSRVHRSQVGVHPLPFASKAVHDWLGPYTGAAEKAVEAVCDGGYHADIQVVCAVLQETFGHPVCTRSTLQTDKLVLDIKVDLVNSSTTDQFKYDAKGFEPIKHKPSLSIGESSSGTLVSSVDIAAKATLVIDLSGPIPKPSVRGGSLSMAVSVHGQGTIKVWFGPMPVPFSDVELSLGDPVKLTVSFGEHDDVGATEGALVPAQGLQGRVTGSDVAGTGLEEAFSSKTNPCIYNPYFEFRTIDDCYPYRCTCVPACMGGSSASISRRVLYHD